MEIIVRCHKENGVVLASRLELPTNSLVPLPLAVRFSGIEVEVGDVVSWVDGKGGHEQKIRGGLQVPPTIGEEFMEKLEEANEIPPCYGKFWGESDPLCSACFLTEDCLNHKRETLDTTSKGKEDMTLKELKAKAKELDIDIKGLSKAEIEEAIEEADEVEEVEEEVEEEETEAPDISEMTMPNLRKYAKEIGLKIGIGKTKAEIIEIVEEFIEGGGLEDEEEPEDEDDGGTDEDSVEDGEEASEAMRAELESISIKDLRAIADTYGVDAKGKKRDAIIDEVVAAIDEDDEDEAEEEPVEAKPKPKPKKKETKTKSKAQLEQQGASVVTKPSAEALIALVGNLADMVGTLQETINDLLSGEEVELPKPSQSKKSKGEEKPAKSKPRKASGEAGVIKNTDLKGFVDALDVEVVELSSKVSIKEGRKNLATAKGSVLTFTDLDQIDVEAIEEMGGVSKEVRGRERLMLDFGKNDVDIDDLADAVEWV